MKKSFITLFAALALSAGLLSSCQDGRKHLTGVRWDLQEIIVEDYIPTVSVPQGVNIIFSDSSRVYGNAGCNNINGGYTLQGKDQITLDRIAATLMWCPNMEFETDYMKLLEKVERFSASDDRLVLYGPQKSFRLIYTSAGKVD
ncbi:MAG: META domain-containing protein [Alistipes sp.]|nr:META domain-containing protein [Alistipes sp.]